MALDSAITSPLDGGGNVEVALTNTPAYIGSVRNLSENDPGTVTGSPYLKSPETSPDFRLRTGVDSLLFTYTFNATAQNTGIWKHAFTTMTMTQSAGALNVNAAGTSTVSGNYAYLQTWRYFPIVGTAPVSMEFTIALATTALQANEVYQWGMGLAQNAAEPPDGIWFELTGAGLYGCVRYNSGTTTKQLLTATARTLGAASKYVAVVSERDVEFWVDDVFYAALDTPAAQGQPCLSAALPVFVEKYNANTVASSPSSILKVFDLTVTLMDLDTSRVWPIAMSSNGLAAQGLDGGTMGGNAFITNNTQPTTALPVNTALTANLPTGIGGGIGLATLWNLAATDMVMTQATNPIGGVNQTPRNLIIFGVTISAVSATAAWTAPAAGTHSFIWQLYWGSTAATLAQTESASFATSTVKAFRRKALGFMTWTTGAAVIGTPASQNISIKFDSPVVVSPGENVGIACRMHNGAATAAGGMLFTYDFDHYFE